MPHTPSGSIADRYVPLELHVVSDEIRNFAGNPDEQDGIEQLTVDLARRCVEVLWIIWGGGIGYARRCAEVLWIIWGGYRVCMGLPLNCVEVLWIVPSRHKNATLSRPRRCKAKTSVTLSWHRRWDDMIHS